MLDSSNRRSLKILSGLVVNRILRNSLPNANSPIRLCRRAVVDANVLYETIRHGVLWYSTILCGTVRQYTAQYGTLQRNKAWYGKVRMDDATTHGGLLVFFVDS